MAGNSGLQAANRAKQDEFYTQLTDIEIELRHYKKHFKGKTEKENLQMLCKECNRRKSGK